MWNKKYYHVESAYCPVCKAKLGDRDPKTAFSAHCSECRATFSWQPYEELPSAALDKNKDKGRCGCASCKEKGR